MTPTGSTDSLSGLIERVTYFNEDNGYAILKVQVKGVRDLVTVPAIPGKHDRARQYLVVLVQRDGEGAARLVLQERPIESVS